MKFPARSIALILCFLSMGATAFAGSFRVISLSQIPGLSSLEFSDNDGPQVLPVSLSSFSQSFPIPATGELPLYDKAPREDEVKSPLLTLRFPRKSGDVIVLLKAVNGPNGPSYGYELLDDSASAFPTGSVFICNYMQEPVIIRLGKKQVVVDPNKHSIVPLTKHKEPFNDGVAFAAEIDGHGRVFSASSWYLAPTMKIFCIIFQDERGNPQIRRIRLT